MVALSAPRQREPAFEYIDSAPVAEDSTAELLAGLRSTPRRINPKYFYDERGSQLFEQITQQPEYYPTRTECTILRRYAVDMARVLGTRHVLLEPGAGNCEKVRLLLDALEPATYVPLDISGDFLCQAATRLAEEYPWLSITALRADFTQLPSLPDSLPPAPRCLFYPGSTLGNFTRSEARTFLRHAVRLIGPSGHLLLGVDLHKDQQQLDAAYNDAAGITAAFNLNVLVHLNALLEANFDPAAFRHIAAYHRGYRRIEMYLESRQSQSVRCAGEVVRLRRGERILTEYSCKYTPEGFQRLARDAGLRIRGCWQDDAGLFAVFALAPLCH